MPSNERVDVFKLYNMTCQHTECWVWQGTTGGRATEPRPYFQAEGKRYLAYRLVYELVHGVTLTKDDKILHSCDNGSMPVGCGNPKHLSIGTTQDNSDDMTARQRHGLPHHVVKAIRALIASGRTQATIAELYGVSRETVSAIATGRSHKHVITGDDTVSKRLPLTKHPDAQRLPCNDTTEPCPEATDTATDEQPLTTPQTTMPSTRAKALIKQAETAIMSGRRGEDITHMSREELLTRYKTMNK